MLDGSNVRRGRRDDDIDLETYKFDGQLGGAFNIPLGISPFDNDVLTLDPPEGA